MRVTTAIFMLGSALKGDEEESTASMQERGQRADSQQQTESKRFFSLYSGETRIGRTDSSNGSPQRR